ncbi:hypothetical protein RhiirC2_773710 [Rhizophagus irregularis]|uniref:Uncharacterized protein n=1 Tax=Rhizophagus irregularis TaxID=588596 RepID=A0A2N1NNB4_9GLOM|nr:hypothetical protein RhiirC2_773710 [Rhizophagus irregularis]
MQLCNPAKYEHTYDRVTGFITVKNIKEDRVVGVFDYPELNDIIENANKNIKKMFLAEVAPKFRQEAYIIGLKLTLDRLARELEFAQKDDCSSKPASPEQ